MNDYALYSRDMEVNARALLVEQYSVHSFEAEALDLCLKVTLFCAKKKEREKRKKERASRGSGLASRSLGS